MIVARRVGYSVSGQQPIAELTLEVAAGERVGITSAGDGVSSLLLRILAALVRPTSGEIAIGGIDLVAEPLRARQLLIYAAPGAIAPAPLLVTEWVESLAAIRGIDVRPRLKTILANAGLRGEASVDQLAVEERGLLSLVLGVAVRPRVLLLDAPLRGMDAARRSRLIGWACEELGEQSAVVLSSNEPSELTTCHRVLRLNAGRLEQEPLRCAG